MQEKIFKQLVINPGSVSTKISYFENETEVWRETLRHDASLLKTFSTVAEQMPYRKELILKLLREKGLSVETLDAISARGGLFRHIPSGTYRVNDKVIGDIHVARYGEHASNLGAYLAAELGGPCGIPAYFTDPVCVDELQNIARISGYKGIERESFFHALNQKYIARKAAAQLQKPYEELRLIVVHLGGGVSVAAHENGRVVDVFNVLSEGSMGLDRPGTLPAHGVVDLCFSGLTKAEVKRKIVNEAGVYSYLGTKDFQEAEGRAFSGDAEAMLIFRALAYQLSKDIGAMFAVLRGRADAIVYTGGMAYSDKLCGEISSYVSAFAPIIRLPGEEEMHALAEGTLRVLRNEAEPLVY